MADYISRERAVNIFSRARAAMKPSDYRTFDEMNTRDLMLLNAEQAINAIPAADVAEVRHARWIRSAYDGEYYCSYCAKMTTDRHDEIRCFEGKKVIALCLPRYCGNCGARMDESEEGDNG